MVAIPKEIRKQFLDGFDSEEYLVAAIKQYLRTPAQKIKLDAADISIEEMLNGRVAGSTNQALVRVIFDEWNEAAGEKWFFGY